MTMSASNFRQAVLLALVAMCMFAGRASAVSWSTKMACASDYYAYCSQYSSGTPEVAKCMRANGSKLSQGCIRALMSEGYVTQADIARHKAKMAAKAGRKPAGEQPAKSEVKVAEKPKAKPEVKTAGVGHSNGKAHSGTTVTAALLPPKPKLVRVGQLRGIGSPERGPAALALNSETYLALKNRDGRFVAADDYVAPIEVVSPGTAPVSWPVAEVKTVSVAPPAKAETPADAYRPETVAAADDQQFADNNGDVASRSAGYPEGRMSLGREGAPEKGGFWSSLIEALSGHGSDR